MASLTTDLELLRTWQAEDFRLHLFYVGTGWGRVRLAYEFYDRGELVFNGDDFYPSPLYVYDGDEAIVALLGFLALRPGDTDREYFTKYSDRQLAWVDERAEALSCAALALSEKRGG
jgi:hypothetical protein